MHPHRFRVPTHLLVAGALFNLNLGLLTLRLGWRQLAWLLGAGSLAAYPPLVLEWPLISLPLLGLPLLAIALCGAFVQVNGLPCDRWLLVVAAYAWSRPRRAVWRPAAARPAATSGAWVRYRPAGRAPGGRP